MENDVTTKAITALNGIPFESIIGGPLSACIKAQADAAVSTVKFIESVGLRGEGDKKEAVYVIFTYVQNGRKANISVPLLTIVPIPYIAISNISLDFKVAISGTESATDVEELSQEANLTLQKEQKKGGGWLTKRKTSKMTTSVSTKKDSKATQESSFSIEATMDVRVQAGQESMPAGMAKILEMLSSAVDVVAEKGELTIDGPYEEENNTKYIIVHYKSPEGLFEPALVGSSSGNGNIVQDGMAIRFNVNTKEEVTITAYGKDENGVKNNDKVIERTITIA